MSGGKIKDRSKVQCPAGSEGQSRGVQGEGGGRVTGTSNFIQEKVSLSV